jgi:uncharacterized membrane-anchored protein YjiN (DUF445 family)
MNIEVTVHADGMDLNAVVDGTINGYDPDADVYVTRPKTLADVIAEKVVEKITREEMRDQLRRVQQIREEMIREAVKPTITRALAEPIEHTNAFGERVAGVAPTTLREIIFNEAKRQANTSVKNDYGSRTGETVLAKFVREEIGAAFKKELADILAEEKAKVVKAVRDNAGTIIADAVKAGLNAR